MYISILQESEMTTSWEKTYFICPKKRGAKGLTITENCKFLSPVLNMLDMLDKNQLFSILISTPAILISVTMRFPKYIRTNERSVSSALDFYLIGIILKKIIKLAEC